MGRVWSLQDTSDPRDLSAELREEEEGGGHTPLPPRLQAVGIDGAPPPTGVNAPISAACSACASACTASVCFSMSWMSLVSKGRRRVGAVVRSGGGGELDPSSPSGGLSVLTPLSCRRCEGVRSDVRSRSLSSSSEAQLRYSPSVMTQASTRGGTVTLDISTPTPLIPP